MPSNGPTPDHRTAVSHEEYALFCWLRLHPDLASTYGITQCDKQESIGSMLYQVLRTAGMNVEWYKQLPNGADAAARASKDKALWLNAMWIKRVARKPGPRTKQLADWPQVAPPDNAAILRRNGRLPRVSFPMLVRLSSCKRPKKFTACGNRVRAPQDVALVERSRLTKYVEKQLRCACGGHLRFSKAGSHQVAACASWCFVCERSCKLPPLLTSAPLHGDDYELNSKLNCAIVTCAISFARVAPLLALLGMAALETTDHYTFKAELEPILADMAEHSMAAAHAENVAAGATDYVTVDGGYTAPRNAKGCTMAAHAADTRIVAVAHKRLTDAGATTSKGLEVLCFLSLLGCVRLAVYATTVFDGCRELIDVALANFKRAQGDTWHVGKNWHKWAKLAVGLLGRRPGKDASETAPNPKVDAPEIDPERLAPYGTAARGVSALDHARERVRALGGTPADGDGLGALKQQFGALAAAAVMTDKEKEQLEKHHAYRAEQTRRKAAGKARQSQAGEAAAAKRTALAWLRDLRSMLRYVGEYTAALRGAINAATQREWTDDERGAEFRRVWRKGCVALVLGRANDPILATLKHPLADATREKAWAPPGTGFVQADSLAFTIIDSIVCDSVWDDKFIYLTDARMTFANESFFHKLRKWGTKHSHFSRFYSIAIWCSVLSWNESATRATLEQVWQRRKSGQLASSAGRAYLVPLRVKPTDFWRETAWRRYLQWARRQEAPPTEPVCSYDLGWDGAQPPRRSTGAAAAAPVAPATSRPEVSTMRNPEMQAELATLGLDTKGKKADLQQRLREARVNPAAAQEARAEPLARRELPAPSSRPSPSRHAATGVLPSYGLPSPYKLPARQRPKRKAPPKGELKYTTARTARAVKAIAAGNRPSQLKRRKESDGGGAGPSSAGGGEEDGDGVGDDDDDDEMGEDDDMEDDE